MVVMLCGLVGRYQCFRGTYCLHVRPWRQYVDSWVDNVSKNVLSPCSPLEVDTVYGLVGRYQHIGGTYCPYHQPWKQYVDSWVDKVS
jgi:hypothetical protein